LPKTNQKYIKHELVKFSQIVQYYQDIMPTNYEDIMITWYFSQLRNTYSGDFIKILARSLSIESDIGKTFKLRGI